jgi:hypothetical protein
VIKTPDTNVSVMLFCLYVSCANSGHAYGELQSVAVSDKDSVLVAAGRTSVFPRVIELSVNSDTNTSTTTGKNKFEITKVRLYIAYYLS